MNADQIEREIMTNTANYKWLMQLNWTLKTEHKWVTLTVRPEDIKRYNKKALIKSHYRTEPDGHTDHN